ncbi:MAG: hypothetical protein Fur0037_15080 [Planctomycetota bacterium]
MTRLGFALTVALFLAAARPQDPIALYEAGRPAEAAAALERELSLGPSDVVPLLYDLGNCSFRLGRLGEAACFYRRALARAPDLEEARWNLRLVQERLRIDEPLPGRRGIRGWIFGPRAGGPPGRARLACAFALQCLGILGLIFWRRARFLCLLLAASGLLAGFLPWIEPGRTCREAVVLVPEAPLRADPSPGGPLRSRLREGEVLRLLQAGPGWILAERGGVKGWVERASVGLVD